MANLAELLEPMPTYRKQRGICSIEQCGKPHCARGYCRRHLRMVNLGQNPTVDKEEWRRAKRSPTARDLEWAAGFLEGEGNFAFTKNGTQRVRASQVNPEPLARLKSIFGGNISLTIETAANKSDYYDWAISGSRARGVMMTLYSLLSELREQQVTTALRGRV